MYVLLLIKIKHKIGVSAATNFLFKVKTYAASTRASNIELLMRVLDFKVDYRLKITQRYFCGMHECLRGCIEERKKYAIYRLPDRNNQITT